MLRRFLDYLKYEPAVVAGAVQAVISLVIALGFHLSATQAAGWEGGASALCGLIVAASVRTPGKLIAAATGFLTALGTLLIAYKVPHVSAGTVSAVNFLVATVLAYLLRQGVTPKAAAPR
jgi:cytochrome bd-type quinol oxidase subunit 1